MLLTQQERDKFAAYCRMEADSSIEMKKTMEDSAMPEAVKQALVKRERLNAQCYLYVALHLTSGEEMTIARDGT